MGKIMQDSSNYYALSLLSLKINCVMPKIKYKNNY